MVAKFLTVTVVTKITRLHFDSVVTKIIRLDFDFCSLLNFWETKLGSSNNQHLGILSYP